MVFPSADGSIVRSVQEPARGPLVLRNKDARTPFARPATPPNDSLETRGTSASVQPNACGTEHPACRRAAHTQSDRVIFEVYERACANFAQAPRSDTFNASLPSLTARKRSEIRRRQQGLVRPLAERWMAGEADSKAHLARLAGVSRARITQVTRPAAGSLGEPSCREPDPQPT